MGTFNEWLKSQQPQSFLEFVQREIHKIENYKPQIDNRIIAEDLEEMRSTLQEIVSKYRKRYPENLDTHKMVWTQKFKYPYSEKEVASSEKGELYPGMTIPCENIKMIRKPFKYGRPLSDNAQKTKVAAIAEKKKYHSDKNLRDLYHVNEFSEYHWRINGFLDIYTVNQKWHDINTGERGQYKDLLKFLAKFV